MKALSLRQPYAELIVLGRKTIELRTWKTKHRGTFLVHASKYKPTVRDCEYFGLDRDKLSYGAIIGTAEILDVKEYLNSEQWHSDVKKHLAGEEYGGSTKGFILKNAERLAHPVPYKGQLQFFDVPVDAYQQCML